jgi:hypothetical protein
MLFLKWLFCEGEAAFPTYVEVREKNKKWSPLTFGAFGCRCLVFLVLAPACAALRFGLLLSALSRLTHIP